jgi:hypothetical protein
MIRSGRERGRGVEEEEKGIEPMGKKLYGGTEKG